MIPRVCKRLAEVDFPIAEVSRHAVAEKRFPVPRGLPSTLHHWWARRPLASSRAILMGLLLPDTVDRHCPAEFKEKARALLLGMHGRPSGWDRLAETDEGLRQMILRFISDFASWNNAADEVFLKTARALVEAAHPHEDPLVVDHFAGGGSIPLEALRLGCEAFASDLNPVACFILKVMLETIPRSGSDVADELQEALESIQNELLAGLADFYPKDPDGATPIAYLWARTVVCEAPDCGAEIPLMRSFWLCKKSNRKRALRKMVRKPFNACSWVDFEIFEPDNDNEVESGTVTGGRATCAICGTTLQPERVRAQFRDCNGGANPKFDGHGQRIGGAKIIAVVIQRPGERGRRYRLPTDADYAAVFGAQRRVADLLREWELGDELHLCPIPNEPLPPVGTLGFRVQRYGILQWGDLFTARQNLSLYIISKIISKIYQSEKSQPIAELLACAVSKVADFNCSLATWRASSEDVGDLFGRQAVPFVWDFVETDINGKAYMGVERAVRHILEVVKKTTSAISRTGSVRQADAAKTSLPLPYGIAEVYFTDPPYYDAVPYSDLSDFFLVWLKRTLPDHPLLVDPFDHNNPLSPKIPEAVQDRSKQYEGSPKNRQWFEMVMAQTFANGRQMLSEDGIGSVVFAHKTTEGWEALLSGMIRGGWTVTGSWPIATESVTRLRARESAALATSVHLVCRPRSESAPVGDWADVLNELPISVGEWMKRLESEGIRGADLVFACVGPALEIYSRYSGVETAEGRAVELSEYLEKVWEVVGLEALGQVLGTVGASGQQSITEGALEEDARLTALFLWTMQSTVSGSNEQSDDYVEEARRHNSLSFTLPFDVVRRFSQPLGIHLDDWENRIIEIKKGVVRLLSVEERSRRLFGESGAGTLADEIESGTMSSLQLNLFSVSPSITRGRVRRRMGSGADESGDLTTYHATTTLDRLHAAMLLQASGRTGALRTLLRVERERTPDFLRLANALSALYPRPSQAKRLVDAMLLAMPR